MKKIVLALCLLILVGCASVKSIDSTGTIDKDGVIGGNLVIFINDSDTDKTIFIEALEGSFKGQKFSLDLLRGESKEFHLMSGQHHAQWTIPGSNTIYPENGPREFLVTQAPHFWYSKTGENYHGGYRLFGEK